MIYGWCLGIAGEDGFMGGIAVMDLLRQDLLLSVTDTLIFGALFGTQLVHMFVHH